MTTRPSYNKGGGARGMGTVTTTALPPFISTLMDHDHQHIASTYCPNGLDSSGIKCADKSSKSSGMYIGDVIGVASVSVVAISIVAALFWKVSDYLCTSPNNSNANGRRYSLSNYFDDDDDIIDQPTQGGDNNQRNKTSCLTACVRTRRRQFYHCKNDCDGGKNNNNSNQVLTEKRVFWVAREPATPVTCQPRSTQGDSLLNAESSDVIAMSPSKQSSLQRINNPAMNTRYLRNNNNGNNSKKKSASVNNFTDYALLQASATVDNASASVGHSRSVTMESFISSGSTAVIAAASKQPPFDADDYALLPPFYTSNNGARFRERLGSSGGNSAGTSTLPLSSTTAVTADQLILSTGQQNNNRQSRSSSPLLISASRLLSNNSGNSSGSSNCELVIRATPVLTTSSCGGGIQMFNSSSPDNRAHLTVSPMSSLLPGSNSTLNDRAGAGYSRTEAMTSIFGKTSQRQDEYVMAVRGPAAFDVKALTSGNNTSCVSDDCFHVLPPKMC